MPDDHAPQLASAKAPSAKAWLFPLALVVGIVIIYCGTLNYPFIFDSTARIEFEPRIRSMPELSPDLIKDRRLFPNISFAINYAISELNPISYHLFNIAIHIANVLLIYWIILKSLALADPVSANSPVKNNPAKIPIINQAHRPLLAFAIAGLWAFHPIQVQSVTYTVQRSESMATTGLLGALLAVLLHAQATTNLRRMFAALVFALFAVLGVYSKEVALVLPLFVYLFDSRVVTGQWLAPIKQRWPLYIVSILVLLIPLLSISRQEMSSEITTGSAGFSQPFITWYGYFLSQPRSILYYIWIALVPATLSLDLGWYVMKTGSPSTLFITPQIALFLIPVTGLFLAGLYLLFKKPWLGFVIIGLFFVVLAPSSSFIPIIDVAFEHRMYLALLTVVICAVALIYTVMTHLVSTGKIPSGQFYRTLSICLCTLMVLLVARSYFRTLDFQSEVHAWKVITQTNPYNQRAWHAVGYAYTRQSQFEEALPYFQAAHEIYPTDPEPLAWKAYCLAKLGRVQEAAQQFDLGIKHADMVKRSYIVFGNAALTMHDYPRTQLANQKAVEHDPGNVNAMTNLGIALARQNQHEQALVQFKSAYDRAPGFFDTAYNYAEALNRAGQADQAMSLYEKLTKDFPQNPRPTLGISRLQMESLKLDDAISTITRALQKSPKDPAFLNQLATLYLLKRDYKSAAQVYNQHLAFEPQNPNLIKTIAWLLATCPDKSVQDPDRAVRFAQAVVQATQAQDLDAIRTLAVAHAARSEFEPAIKILQELKTRAIAAGLTSELPDIDAKISQFRRRQPYIDNAPFVGTPLESLDKKLNPPPGTSTGTSTAPSTSNSSTSKPSTSTTTTSPSP